MQTHRTLSALLFAAVLSASATSFAQLPAGMSAAPDEALNETTRELFAKGVKASQQQKWDQCRAAFLAAYGVKKHPQIAGNLALCELKLGMFRDAAEHIAFFLSTQKADTPKERRAAAEMVQREAGAKITTVRLDVDRSGAEVLVDGKSMGNAPLAVPIFLDQGGHTIEARLDGYTTARRSVDAAAGVSVEIGLKLVPVASRDVEPPVLVAKRPIWPAIASGGLAVLGLAVGAGLTVAANGKGSEADALRATLPNRSACYGAGASSMTCKSLNEALGADSALSKGAVSSYVVGGLFAVAATALGVWSVSGSPPKREGISLQVVPVFANRETGVVIGGRW